MNSTHVTAIIIVVGAIILLAMLLKNIDKSFQRDHELDMARLEKYGIPPPAEPTPYPTTSVSVQCTVAHDYGDEDE